MLTDDYSLFLTMLNTHSFVNEKHCLENWKASTTATTAGLSTNNNSDDLSGDDSQATSTMKSVNMNMNMSTTTTTTTKAVIIIKMILTALVKAADANQEGRKSLYYQNLNVRRQPAT